MGVIKDTFKEKSDIVTAEIKALLKEHGNKNTYTVGTFYVGKENASNLGKDRFFFQKKLEEIVWGKE